MGSDKLSGVTDIDGVGQALGKKLKAKGFDKAEVLLGKFLSLKKNKDDFIAWMMDRPYEATRKQSNDCYQCLSSWWETHC